MTLPVSARMSCSAHACGRAHVSRSLQAVCSGQSTAAGDPGRRRRDGPRAGAGRGRAGVGRHADRRRRPRSGRRGAGRGGQRAGEARRPDRARRGAGAARGRAGARRRLAADRLHARGHARALHDVRRAPACWPGSPGWSTAPTTPRRGRPDRCGTSSATAGSTTAPRSSAGVRAEESATLLRAFFRRPAGPVVSPAVACPSGRRSTPRKRVRASPSVGSNPTATASWFSPDAERPAP